MPASSLEALRRRDRSAVDEVAGSVIKPRRDNLVARPWGGRRLFDYKSLDPADYHELHGAKLGESFELAADDDDREAREHPSVVPLVDGGSIALPELLALAGDAILGSEHLARHGPRLPLLPKTLDVAELLSVQAHPAGNVEAYVVIDADPGATLHLGFARDVDRAALASRMQDGIACQRRLETMLDANAIQTALRPLLQSREPAMAAVLDPLSPRLRADVDRGELERVLVELAATYWYVLEQLNRVEVRPGQVIFNATPERLSSAGPSCAEVHALGNSDGKEMLILEIRRPGITLRAWDHVRFPMREVAVEPALDAMGLAATTPDDFEVIASPLAGQPGVWRSVVCPMFTMDHLRPRPGADVAIDAQAPHTLHCIAGGAAIVARHGSTALGRGESALIGARLGSYRVRSEATDTEVVKVTLGA